MTQSRLSEKKWVEGTGLWANTAPIQGNLIGTDVTGTRALGNSLGIQVGFANGVVVRGTNAADRNIISGNGYGINLSGEVGARVLGNYIGTDITGTTIVDRAGYPIGNIEWVTVQYDNSDAMICGNLISGNQVGVDLREQQNSAGITVQGNKIGTDETGTYALGYGLGVYLADNASNNTIIGNTISGNGTGVYINGGPGVFGNTVLGNFIGTDSNGQPGTLPGMVRGNIDYVASKSGLGNSGGVVSLAASENTIGGQLMGRAM